MAADPVIPAGRTDGPPARPWNTAAPAKFSSRDARRDYLPAVDGLRAIAVLAVMVYHARPEWLPGGYAGVDVFFVISGFLITRIIVGELAAGRFRLGRFLERRARR